jgi:hypothetical protein
MRLFVPNRTVPCKGSFNGEPAEVKAWIERLSTAEVGQTSRLLFEALADLNQQDIPAQQRFEVLEMLREPVRFVTGHMEKYFVAQPLPLAPRNLLVAQLTREITHLLATGYKILVTEQLAGIGRSDRQLLITSIHRATTLLSAVLLKAYQVYEPYPDCAWLELHSLYRYAEEKRLHTAEVTDAYLRSRDTSTVADAYKQVLLLALACPYRLRQEEVTRIYEALEQWAPLARLRPLDETASDLFVTDLNSDAPPTYLMLSEPGANRNSYRALDTAPLAEQLESSEGRNPAAGLDIETLRRLRLAWGMMPKRGYTRIKGSSHVTVSVGLRSVHYFVSGEAAFCAKPAPIRPCAEPPASRGYLGTNRPIDDATLPTGISLPTHQATSGPRIDTSHTAQSWKMLNISAGGYCLLRDNPEASRAQVGELLGIREQSDPDTFHWQLGVIRWLKCSDRPGVELGVQMLSPGAVAVAARPDRHNDGKYTPGLLLPANSTVQQEATLLLSSPPFRPGSTVITNCQGRRMRVRLTKLVENTGSFAQFQFISLGELGPDTGRDQTEDRNQLNFNDIWSFL